MNMVRTRLFPAISLAAGVLMAVISPSAFAQGGSGPPTAKVEIVNPLPLPVSGNVNITNSAPIPVSGTIQGTVENASEPGREPLSMYLEFTTFSCGFNCTGFVKFGSVILVDTSPAVPDGKQWVITHVSGRLPTTDSPVHVALQSQPVLTLQLVKTAFFGPFYPYGSMQAFSGPVYGVIGSGEKAHLNLLVPNQNNFVGFVNLSGYLIDAPPLANALAIAPTAIQSSGGAPLMAPGSLEGPRPELEQN